MGVRIVTDTAGDIPRKLTEELGIITVPIRVIIGGASYRDGTDKLPPVTAGAITSQPSPWEFINVFSQLQEQGEDVLCLTLSGVLSGTYQSAAIAARQLGGNIRVIDTQLVSAGQGLLVTRLAALAAQGHSLEELAARAEEEMKRIRVYATLDNVEAIVQGGRTSLFALHAAGREGIKLIFTFNRQGGIQILQRVRGRKASLDRLIELMTEANCSQIAIVHVDASTEAAMVARSIEERCQARVLYVQDAGATVRTYAGRGAVIVAG